MKNPFNAEWEQALAAHKKKSLQATQKAAVELFKDKPFFETEKPIYNAVIGIKYLLNAVSFITALVGIVYLLSFLVGFYVACFAALGIGFAIEYLKNNVWNRVYKDAVRYRTLSKVFVVLLIVVHAASLGTSAIGAFIIPSVAPMEEKKDSVFVSSYDDEILVINNQISEQTKILVKSDGTRSTTVQTALNGLNEQKKKLVALRDVQQISFNEYMEANKQSLIEQHEQKKEHLKNVQWYCFYAAIVMEFLYILCVLYGFSFLYRIYIETTAKPKQPTPTPTPQTVPPTTPEESPELEQPETVVNIVETPEMEQPEATETYTVTDFDSEQPHNAPPANVGNNIVNVVDIGELTKLQKQYVSARAYIEKQKNPSARALANLAAKRQMLEALGAELPEKKHKVKQKSITEKTEEERPKIGFQSNIEF